MGEWGEMVGEMERWVRRGEGETGEVGKVGGTW